MVGDENAASNEYIISNRDPACCGDVNIVAESYTVTDMDLRFVTTALVSKNSFEPKGFTCMKSASHTDFAQTSKACRSMEVKPRPTRCKCSAGEQAEYF